VVRIELFRLHESEMMGKWIVIKCRECGAILIAKEHQVSKQCTYCRSWLVLYKLSITETKDCRTTVPKRQRIKHRSSIPAVVILATLETFDEASDAARLLKLPKDLRDDENLFISSAWK